MQKVALLYLFLAFHSQHNGLFLAPSELLRGNIFLKNTRYKRRASTKSRTPIQQTCRTHKLPQLYRFSSHFSRSASSVPSLVSSSKAPLICSVKAGFVFATTRP